MRWKLGVWAPTCAGRQAGTSAGPREHQQHRGVEVVGVECRIRVWVTAWVRVPVRVWVWV